MPETTLPLGESADETRWRALVEKGLKGALWAKLARRTGDGLEIAPLYREADIATASDVSGFPGAAPFVRGAGAGAWRIHQAYAQPDPARANADILADLAGGVGAIELIIDPRGENGIAIRDGADLDAVLAEVILEAAPVSLDAGAHGRWAASLLGARLKGVAVAGTAFNIDPIGALMRAGRGAANEITDSARAGAALHGQYPLAKLLRIDARPVHEAGGTEAQEIAAALTSGICYMRALTQAGLAPSAAAGALSFAISVGPDVLIEAAKLRALRLCWARIAEAFAASPRARAAHIHAFTSRRMLTRHDVWTNILRITSAAFAAGIGGADSITTAAFTDALGLPTPFARRVARNTQNVLLEECRLGHVADPAGGAWFVEKMTRDLAAAAWALMQKYESIGGVIAALSSGALQADIGAARAARERAIATRRETITGVTDFPLLGAAAPEVLTGACASGKAAPAAPAADTEITALTPIRWAAPFEALRSRAEQAAKPPGVFFALLGALASAGQRAQFARNLFAAGGVAAIGEENFHETRDAMIDAFRAAPTRAAVICGTDAAYAEEAENAAQRLKAAGATWVILAGKPGESEAALRAAGVDQFIFAGQDALEALGALHRALAIAA